MISDNDDDDYYYEYYYLLLLLWLNRLTCCGGTGAVEVDIYVGSVLTSDTHSMDTSVTWRGLVFSRHRARLIRWRHCIRHTSRHHHHHHHHQRKLRRDRGEVPPETGVGIHQCEDPSQDCVCQHCVPNHDVFHDVFVVVDIDFCFPLNAEFVANAQGNISNSD